VADALGIDPKTLATVPCNYDNQTYSDVMFKMVMGSPPLSGVDYWWTDYGGCSNSLDPAPALWWTNYLFVEHMNVAGKLRPLLLSRYGGIGSQRLPIGFSGDTFQDYGTLEYEIQMTPTSSNVLFAYWSHDIGGNHNGTDCPGTDNPLDLFGMELLVRWLQFAAVSPIWRTHCSCDRYFWTFPYFDFMRQAFHLRNALGPYIYTSARQAYDTAVGLVHPLYYEWPEEDGAYAFRDQYMFGPDVLAAPIARPSDELTRRVAKDVWLPPGRWVSWDGATVFDGPHVVSRADWTLADLPMYARAGAVIPMKTMASVATMTPVDPLVWVIFSAGGPLSGSGRLYEDDGVSLAYTSPLAAWATTEVDYLSSPAAGTTSITIGAMAGGFAGAPTSRGHVLQLRGHTQPPQSVTCNGVAVPKAGPEVVPGWYVEGANATSPLLTPAGSLVVSLGSLPVAQPAVVVLNWW
jgi:alpha-glucosidase